MGDLIGNVSHLFIELEDGLEVLKDVLSHGEAKFKSLGSLGWVGFLADELSVELVDEVQVCVELVEAEGSQRPLQRYLGREVQPGGKIF